MIRLSRLLVSPPLLSVLAFLFILPFPACACHFGNLSRCSEDNVTCYLSLPLPPYVIFRSDAEIPSPIPCKQYASHGVDGIVMELMQKVFQEGDLCYFQRESRDCSFNELVGIVQKNDTESDRRLVALGALLEVPARRRNNGLTSVSIVDDSLALVGKHDGPHSSELAVLSKPFEKKVWFAVFGTLALLLIAAWLLKYSDPDRRSSGVDPETRAASSRRRFCQNHILDSAVQSLGFLFDRLEMLTFGEAVQRDAEPDPGASTERQGMSLSSPSSLDGDDPAGVQRASWPLGFYKLVRVLLATTITFFFAVFLIFYQAALTNFLFQSTGVPYRRSVTKLTDAELQNYLVLNDSGVANAWFEIQRENTADHDPWSRCFTLDECFEKVKKEGKLLVIQESVAKYRFREEKLCSTLAFLNTEETLFNFNAGLIYGPNTSKEFRRKIDEAFLQDRLSDTIRTINNRFLGTQKEVCERETNQITWKIYVIPTAVICSILIFIIIVQGCLLRMKHLSCKREQHKSAGTLPL